MAKTNASKPADNPTPAAKQGKPIAKQAKPAVKKTPRAAAAAKETKPAAPVVVPAEQLEPVKPAKKVSESKPAQAARAESEAKARKPKLVRDSFSMPESEYAALGEIKKACLKAGIDVKKSELLRAGVALLKRLDTAGVKDVLASLPALKAGRPKKGK